MDKSVPKMIVLASGSPRRRMILTDAGFDFVIIPSVSEEVPTQTSPGARVMELASAKAMEVYERVRSRRAAGETTDGKLTEGEPATCKSVDVSETPAFTEAMQELGNRPYIVVGADTLVFLDELPLGKPKDYDDAVRMVSMLRGRKHVVCTGVCIVDGQTGTCDTFFAETSVEVREMSDAEVRAYVDTGEPMDKAGAYAIQGKFAKHIAGIEGEYSNVVGFPISEFYAHVRDMMQS